MGALRFESFFFSEENEEMKREGRRSKSDALAAGRDGDGFETFKGPSSGHQSGQKRSDT